MSEAPPQVSMPKFGLSPRTFILLGLLVLVFLFITGVVSPVGLFDVVLLQPMLNFLVLLSGVFFGSFGLSIVVLTVIVRVVTLPLTLRQLHSSRSMQELQPKMKELQKKYAKDKERLNQETMKLYKEHGVNPLGCAFPMLIQFPIWIALYQAIIQGLGYAPENRPFEIIGPVHALAWEWVFFYCLPLGSNQQDAEATLMKEARNIGADAIIDVRFHTEDDCDETSVSRFGLVGIFPFLMNTRAYHLSGLAIRYTDGDEK